MRYLWLVLPVFLGACAAPSAEERAASINGRFGPGCTGQGYAPDTDEYRKCVATAYRDYRKDAMARYAADQQPTGTAILLLLR